MLDLLQVGLIQEGQTMFWTWDRYRGTTQAWTAGASRPRHDEQPLSGFSRQVDRLFYGAVAVLAACVTLLLIQ